MKYDHYTEERRLWKYALSALIIGLYIVCIITIREQGERMKRMSERITDLESRTEALKDYSFAGYLKP